MTRKTLVPLLTLAASALAPVGCGDGKTTTPPPTMETTYRTFKDANYATQRAHVALYERLDALGDDPAFAAASFGAYDPDLTAATAAGRCAPRGAAPAVGTVADLYLSSSFCEKVAGASEAHTYGEGFGVDGALGARLHATIVGAIKAGGAAADADGRKVALETIAKTLLRYFYEGVAVEMFERYAKGWDEAFGFWGASNDLAMVQGVASVARKRDTNYMTSFERTIGQQFIKGRAEVASAYMKAGKSVDDTSASLKAGESPALDGIIADIDQKILLVFAYSAAREWDEWIDEPGERAKEYAEGVAFTGAIIDYVGSKDAAGATAMKAALKTADTFTQADAMTMITTIQRVFGITIP
jgi:hypothetical protein